MQSISDRLRAFEEDLGLPAGFFSSLREENDWSLVIKLHAVVEASLSHLLTETLGRNDLLGIFSRLEISNPSTGKVAFGRELGCLSEEDRRFISSLSELRNHLVHDIRNASFSLPAWVGSRDINQLRTFARAVHVEREATPDSEHTAQAIKSVKDDARACLWVRTMVFAFHAYEARSAAQKFHWQNEMLRLGSGVDDDEEEEGQLDDHSESEDPDSLP